MASRVYAIGLQAQNHRRRQGHWPPAQAGRKGPATVSPYPGIANR